MKGLFLIPLLTASLLAGCGTNSDLGAWKPLEPDGASEDFFMELALTSGAARGYRNRVIPEGQPGEVFPQIRIAPAGENGFAIVSGNLAGSTFRLDRKLERNLRRTHYMELLSEPRDVLVILTKEGPTTYRCEVIAFVGGPLFLPK